MCRPVIFSKRGKEKGQQSHGLNFRRPPFPAPTQTAAYEEACGVCPRVLLTLYPGGPSSMGRMLPLFRLTRCEQVFRERESADGVSGGPGHRVACDGVGQPPAWVQAPPLGNEGSGSFIARHLPSESRHVSLSGRDFQPESRRSFADLPGFFS